MRTIKHTLPLNLSSLASQLCLHWFLFSLYLLRGISSGMVPLTHFFSIIVSSSFHFYFFRKRNDERSRQSKDLEGSFSERLAKKHKKNVRFTSQAGINKEADKRKQISGNSKRKNSVEEGQTNVVFTIPTPDVYPEGKNLFVKDCLR